jgi:hypothetical protein
MRVDDEGGLACVVRAAGRRIDDVTLVSGAAPIRIALERGVRCPFGIYLVLSFNRPEIVPLFSPGIASPVVFSYPAPDPAAGTQPVRWSSGTFGSALPAGTCGMNAAPHGFRFTMTAAASMARLLRRLCSDAETEEALCGSARCRAGQGWLE